MRIFRETYGSKEIKATELYANATMSDWNSLCERARDKAARSDVGFQLPKIYPESAFSFSVEVNSGKKYRFRRTR